MADDGIRERHGVTARKSGYANEVPINVWEEGQSVVIAGNVNDAALTPDQARYLASKLYRLARRIDKRNEP